MIGAYKDMGNPELSFTEWMKFGVPLSFIMVLIIWVWLSRGGKERIARPDPGNCRILEIRTLLIFRLTALAWITRSEQFGGWKTWFDHPLANEASVAFIGVLDCTYRLELINEYD